VTAPAADVDIIPAEFHRLTSYDADRHWAEPVDDPRVRADFIPMRPGRRPQPFKSYPAHLERLELAREPGSATGTGPDADDLAAILFLAAGVVRYRDEPDGRRTYFRAASSAGNLHPIEVFVCARGVPGLPDGVWHYGPREHQLTRVGPAPRGAATSLVLTGVPWRTCWKYAERGYRHLWWDCGTVLAQALCAADERGLDARYLTRFDDAAVARLVGATGDEVPLAIVPLAAGQPAVEPSGPAIAGDLGKGIEDFPLIRAIHAAGGQQGRSVQVGRAKPLPAGPLDQLVRRRGSARRFDPTVHIGESELRRLIDATDLPPGIRVHVLAHAVTGLPAAAYRWTATGPVPTGPADRAASAALCLGQDLGRDASAVVFFVADEVPAGARAYREALLAAGIGLGRLYLAATAYGIGCSGLTFVDSMLPEALGESHSVAGLAVAGLGRTPYRARSGGGPAAPTALSR
jgi:SagB-type dehydrogenase family enzyme